MSPWRVNTENEMEEVTLEIVEIYFNDGEAKTFKKVNITDESYDTYQVAVGQIRGSELPDIILANSNFLNLYFLSRKR